MLMLSLAFEVLKLRSLAQAFTTERRNEDRAHRSLPGVLMPLLCILMYLYNYCIQLGRK